MGIKRRGEAMDMRFLQPLLVISLTGNVRSTDAKKNN
jgi:hypothetical protein